MSSSKVLAFSLGMPIIFFAPTSFAQDVMDAMQPPVVVATTLDKAIDEIEKAEPPPAVQVHVATDEDDQLSPPPVPRPEAAVKVAQAQTQADSKTPDLKVSSAPGPVPSSRVVEAQSHSSFFGLSIGVYDPFTHGDRAVAFNAQYEPAFQFAGLQPIVGGMVSTKGSLLGYAGVGVPIQLSERFRVMPSVAVGAYRAGSGFDLGQSLVWRGGLEVSYIFPDNSRLGLGGYMITNGSFGRDDRTEFVGVSYTVPFDLFGGPQPEPLAQKATP